MHVYKAECSIPAQSVTVMQSRQAAHPEQSLYSRSCNLCTNFIYVYMYVKNMHQNQYCQLKIKLNIRTYAHYQQISLTTKIMTSIGKM